MIDDAAFETFVRANGPALLRTSVLLAGSRPAGEDLLQDTLTHLYSRWEKVSAADAPVAYVRRALANRYASSMRPGRAREIALADLPDAADYGDVAESVAVRSSAWQLLAGLPPKQRSALVLRYYHDLSDEQIADHLDCRPATVRSLISRGTASVRSALGSATDRREVSDGRA